MSTVREIATRIQTIGFFLDGLDSEDVRQIRRLAAHVLASPEPAKGAMSGVWNSFMEMVKGRPMLKEIETAMFAVFEEDNSTISDLRAQLLAEEEERRLSQKDAWDMGVQLQAANEAAQFYNRKAADAIVLRNEAEKQLQAAQQERDEHVDNLKRFHMNVCDGYDARIESLHQLAETRGREVGRLRVEMQSRYAEIRVLAMAGNAHAEAECCWLEQHMFANPAATPPAEDSKAIECIIGRHDICPICFSCKACGFDRPCECDTPPAQPPTPLCKVHGTVDASHRCNSFDNMPWQVMPPAQEHPDTHHEALHRLNYVHSARECRLCQNAARTAPEAQG